MRPDHYEIIITDDKENVKDILKISSRFIVDSRHNGDLNMMELYISVNRSIFKAIFEDLKVTNKDLEIARQAKEYWNNK